MSKEKILLHDGVTQSDVDSALYTADLNIVEVIEGNEERPAEFVWETVDGKHKLHHIHDFLLEAQYIVVVGPGPGPLAEEIRSSLKTVDKKDVLARAKRASSGEARLKAVHGAAALAPESFDPELAAVIENALASDDPEMRSAGILATGYAEWKEFQEPLKRLAAEDPDPDVREEAGAMLEGLQEVWKQRK
jgi:hypothetical protein